MERTQLFDLMGELKLYGMKAAFDEIMATAALHKLFTGPVPRQHIILWFAAGYRMAGKPRATNHG